MKNLNLFLFLLALALLSSCSMQKKTACDPYYSLGPKGKSRKVDIVDPVAIKQTLKKDSIHCIINGITAKTGKEGKVKTKVFKKQQHTIVKSVEFNNREVLALLRKAKEKPLVSITKKQQKWDNGIGEMWGAIFKVLEVMFYILVIAGFLGFVGDLIAAEE